MKLVHLTASTFHGGPERQMLALGRHLPPPHQSVYLSFAEGGRCRFFLAAARQQGLEAFALDSDTPRFLAAIREIARRLRQLDADVLLCHGYKASLLGRPAARCVGIPAVAVSRGWTGENFRVRMYERLDRLHLRCMDHVVAVSHAQAEKVRRAGVPGARVRVIHNAVDPDRFSDPDPNLRGKLARLFRSPRSRLIGAAGRLSPEKGFDVLVAAAEQVLRDDPTVGFIVFGDGPCRTTLMEQIRSRGIESAFVLAGFRGDLDRILPVFDLLVLPSFTEGLPNIVLEACAAGVPVVATAVGGTPEILEDGVSGWLAPPGNPDALAGRMLDAMTSEEHLREIGYQGRLRVLEHFSFQGQVEQYLDLLTPLCAPARKPTRGQQIPPLQRAEPTCER